MEQVSDYKSGAYDRNDKHKNRIQLEKCVSQIKHENALKAFFLN